jgi:L-rhamnose mutarotase
MKRPATGRVPSVYDPRAYCQCTAAHGHRRAHHARRHYHTSFLRRVEMQRYGSVVALKPDRVEEYKQLHADVWPEVLAMIRQCNIQNYSIYLRTLPDGRPYLFSYFEYTGEDFEADAAKMAADPATQRWWAVCKPCQEPLPDREEGEWWAAMTEVFHMD